MKPKPILTLMSKGNFSLSLILKPDVAFMLWNLRKNQMDFLQTPHKKIHLWAANKLKKLHRDGDFFFPSSLPFFDLES